MMPEARFRLADSTILAVAQGDITKYSGDAIVNAANEQCLGGGGVDGAIHSAAGPGLLEECRHLPEVQPSIRCPTGEAKITRGHKLPARHVIHTVGPVYQNSQVSEPLLYNAYKNSLKAAAQNGVKSIAFPAISCGIYGYPIKAAATVCIKACMEHGADMEEIVLMQFSPGNYEIFKSAAAQSLKAL